jgi:hypothetical protein
MSAPPDEPHQPPPGLAARRTLPHWLLEGLLIVISVALGFGVAQVGEYRSNRDLARRALTSVQAEVESNLALLEPLVPIHRRWSDALRTADTSNGAQSGLDILFATRPSLPANSPPFPVLRRSAWDATVSSGALRFIDYGIAEALSEIYRAQEIATSNVDRLANGALTTTATFDPANRAAAVRMLWLTIEDITVAEANLLDLYQRHLAAVRAAVAGAS